MGVVVSHPPTFVTPLEGTQPFEIIRFVGVFVPKDDLLSPCEDIENLIGRKEDRPLKEVFIGKYFSFVDTLEGGIGTVVLIDLEVGFSIHSTALQ